MNPTSSAVVVSLAERRAAKRDRVASAGLADAIAEAVITDRGLTTPEAVAPDPALAEVLAAVLNGQPDEPRKGDRLSHDLGQHWLKLLLSRPEMADLTQDEQRKGPWDIAPGLQVAGRMPPAQTHRGPVGHLEQLAPQLVDELERITLPFCDHAPGDAELRLAQTQLDDWLEQLSYGIQAELFALQMAAQQQLLNIADLAAASARYRATNAGQDRSPSQSPHPGMPAPDQVGQTFRKI
jgi:hypothetical protein